MDLEMGKLRTKNGSRGRALYKGERAAVEGGQGWV